MGFINFKTYIKLNENISIVTDKYSELVAIAKEFEEILGEKEMKGTGLIDSLKKLNELILDYKEIGEVTDLEAEADAAVQPAEIETDVPTDVPVDVPVDVPAEIPGEVQEEMPEETQEEVVV